MKKRLSSQLGANLTEYVIILTILIVVFLAGGLAIESAASTRGDFSMEVGNSTVPCATGPLAAVGAVSPDACK
jgi:hypothetical protein